jgi:hypothetical protein
MTDNKIVGLYGIVYRPGEFGTPLSMNSTRGTRVLVATFDSRNSAIHYAREARARRSREGFYHFHPDSVLYGFMDWEVKPYQKIIHNPIVSLGWVRANPT